MPLCWCWPDSSSRRRGSACDPSSSALPLFASLLWIVAGRREHPGRLWAAPFLAALCANLHGSFALFPVVVGLAWLEDRRRKESRASRTLLITGVTAVATLANPFGPRVWTYAYDLSTNPVIRDTINEWKPLTLGTVPGWFVDRVCARGRHVPDPAEAADPLDRARDARVVLPPRPVGAARDRVVGHGRAGRSGRAPVRRQGAARQTASGGAARFSRARLRDHRQPRRPDRDPRPMVARDVVRAVPRGSTSGPHRSRQDRTRAGNPNAGASAVGVVVRVRAAGPTDFVDSRIEIIPSDVWHDYGQVGFSGAEWQDVLNRWDVQAVVAAADWDLLPVLEAPGSGWRLVYQDDDGALLVRA